MAQRKTQIRFSAEDDINLLKEVVAENPFLDRSKWTVTANNMASATKHTTMDTRRARERTMLLLQQYTTEERESLRRYSTYIYYERHYTEYKELKDALIRVRTRYRINAILSLTWYGLSRKQATTQTRYLANTMNNKS